ncbi:MAG: methyltransferase domain-containing protein [Vicingaceae bacterium]|nr:methyltransferase domain-containing protein [Vicingaceae bacterium]
MGKLFSDKPRYFEIQYLNSRDSIIPFLDGIYTPKKNDNILEIGSSEGGVLRAFTELECKCTGIELAQYRVDLANGFMSDEVKKGLVNFISEDIFNIDPNSLPHKFDLIILKDVIEHIHNQEKFMNRVEEFLTDDGVIFFGFPAWRMPYGGHQQCAESKLMAKLPYYHLLPMFAYKGLLKLFGEKQSIVDGLVEIKETGISTKRFEKICKDNNYKIVKQIKYFVAPIYEYKFGYKTKLLPKWLGAIPFFNDFFTFQSYYIVKK